MRITAYSGGINELQEIIDKLKAQTDNRKER